MLKVHKPPQSHKRLCHEKQKVTAFSSPLSDKRNEGTKAQLNPLPSCATAKNARDARKIMTNEKEAKLKEEKQKKKLSVESMQLAEASKSIGLGDLRGKMLLCLLKCPLMAPILARARSPQESLPHLQKLVGKMVVVIAILLVV